LLKKKGLKNYEPISLTCMTKTSIKTLTNTWSFDGKTVSFEGSPLKMGRDNGEVLKKLEGREKFKYTVYSSSGVFLNSWTIDFYKGKLSTEIWGGKYYTDCF